MRKIMINQLSKLRNRNNRWESHASNGSEALGCVYVIGCTLRWWSLNRMQAATFSSLTLYMPYFNRSLHASPIIYLPFIYFELCVLSDISLQFISFVIFLFFSYSVVFFLLLSFSCCLVQLKLQFASQCFRMQLVWHPDLQHACSPLSILIILMCPNETEMENYLLNANVQRNGRRNNNSGS